MILEEIQQVMQDPAASSWLKVCLATSLTRDPVDVANDADVLASLLSARADEMIRDGLAPQAQSVGERYLHSLGEDAGG